MLTKKETALLRLFLEIYFSIFNVLISQGLKIILLVAAFNSLPNKSVSAITLPEAILKSNVSSLSEKLRNGLKYDFLRDKGRRE